MGMCPAAESIECWARGLDVPFYGLFFAGACKVVREVEVANRARVSMSSGLVHVPFFLWAQDTNIITFITALGRSSLFLQIQG